MEFRQQNGERIFFEKGSPNLIKCKLKMSEDRQNFFYISVSSKPTENFPENTPSRFEVELPREYATPGEWAVCVTNAYIPPPRNFLSFDEEVVELSAGEAYFCVWPTKPDGVKKCAKLDLLKFTKREFCIFLTVNFPEIFDIYLDRSENIFLLLKI